MGSFNPTRVRLKRTPTIAAMSTPMLQPHEGPSETPWIQRYTGS